MRVLLAALTLFALTACDFGQDTNSPAEETKANPCKGLDEVSCSSNVMCEWKAGQYGETKKCKPKAE